jgi:hypothetical protein
VYTTLDIHYAQTQIANAGRTAERDARHAREAGERCVRSGLLRLCHGPEDAGS